MIAGSRLRAATRSLSAARVRRNSAVYFSIAVSGIRVEGRHWIMQSALQKSSGLCSCAQRLAPQQSHRRSDNAGAQTIYGFVIDDKRLEGDAPIVPFRRMAATAQDTLEKIERRERRLEGTFVVQKRKPETDDFLVERDRLVRFDGAKFGQCAHRVIGMPRQFPVVATSELPEERAGFLNIFEIV